jgi:hypothetical protein
MCCWWWYFLCCGGGLLCVKNVLLFCQQPEIVQYYEKIKIIDVLLFMRVGTKQ